MKYLTQFLSDLGDLPKHEFGRKYILPPAFLFFLYGLLLNVYELHLERSDLVHERIKVSEIYAIVTSEVNKPSYQKIDQEIRIFTSGSDEYFRIPPSLFSDPIVDDIKIGDSIDVYYRPRIMSLLGMGKKLDIYELEFNNKTYLDLRDRKASNSAIAAICFVFTLVFGAIYFYFRTKKYLAGN